MIYRFGDCELDEGLVELRRAGEVVPIEPQVYDVLRFLVERSGTVVTKEELLDTVWGSRFVSESALTSRIKSARRAVGDDGTRQAVIGTVHGKGYKLTVPVTELAESAPAPAATPEPSGEPRFSPSPLPHALHRLIGREQLLATLESDLDDARLLTIVGPAGVGKTSVALEFARRAQASRVDGVVLVELVGVGPRDGDATLAAVANALEVNVRQQASIETAILETVATRDLLLLLDNCEHVIEAVAGLVEKVLQFAPSVTVVATSREALSVAGERLRVVEPLEVADVDSISLADLAEVPAIALFTERAKAIDADFAVNESNAAAVAEICRRLDGVPLALELAASRVHAIDVNEIARRLDERLRLLRAVRRGADPRHSTLSDAISWSYDLLDPDEQRLFRKLAVFSGPFDLEDAESVCEGEDDVLDLLARLSQRSMIVVKRSASSGTRYEMFETLREFGLERLDNLANVDLFQAHARHYVGVANRIEELLQGPDEAVGMTRGDWSFADLRAAQRFALQSDDLDGACRLVTGLGEYAMRAMRHEVFAWADALAARLSDQPHPLRPVVTGLCGYSAFVRGDVENAVRLADLAADDLREQKLDPLELVERVRANALYLVGRVDDGHAACAAMIDVADASGRASEQAHANYMSAIGACIMDEVEVAEQRCRAAFDAAQRSGSPTDLASAWVAKGFVTKDDDEAALAAFASSDRIARSVGNRWMSAFAVTEASALHLVRGEVAQACRGLAETVDIWYRAGEWAQQWLTLSRCVVALDRIGERELATEVLGAVEDHTTIDATPVLPSVGEVARRTRQDLVGTLGADRFRELHAAGSRAALPVLVDRTRRVLLGQQVG